MSDFAVARHNVLESQLRPNQIVDPNLLQAMGEIPRERFMPERLRGIAYVDEDIAIGGGRFVMEPLVLARLLQLAEVRPTDRALDIGCTTGYATAVLAKLCGKAIGLDSDPVLVSKAAGHFRALGIHNASAVEGALRAGYAASAPYDVILVDGGVEEVPSALTDQLAEGGRLVTVLRPKGAVGRTALLTRQGRTIASRMVHDAATFMLPGFARPREFVF